MRDMKELMYNELAKEERIKSKVGRKGTFSAIMTTLGGGIGAIAGMGVYSAQGAVAGSSVGFAYSKCANN